MNIILKNKEKIRETEREVEKEIERNPSSAVEVCVAIALIAIFPFLIAFLIGKKAWLVVLGIIVVIYFVIFAKSILYHKFLTKRLGEFREIMALLLSGIIPDGIEPIGKTEVAFIFTSDTGEKIRKVYRCFWREYSQEEMDENEAIIDCESMTIRISAAYILKEKDQKEFDKQ